MTGSKGHILVVDDVEDNRLLLEHFLQTSGFGVETASDGEKALDIILSDPPDAVLLDMMMPRLSGTDVCRRIRQEESLASLPVIMVTARSESRDIVDALRAGASDYVTKPIDFDVLMARLDTQLRLASLQAEARSLSDQLMAEMRAAREVQESLLPGEKQTAGLPENYGLSVGAVWQPGRVLAGDCWDLVALADGSLGLLLINFEGTGVVPALQTFRMKTFIQGQCRDLYNVALTMARLNTHLCSFLSGSSRATGLYARFDPDRQEFTVASASSPGPLVWRAEDQAIERLVVDGPPLGVSQESGWREAVMPVHPGDRVAFFTSGLLASGARETGFSEQRLGEFLARHAAESPEVLREFFSAELEQVTHRRSSADVTSVFCALTE